MTTTTPIRGHELPAVRDAYEARAYTDRNGHVWRLGMDGWFNDQLINDGVLLIRHHDFVQIVEKEHAEA